MLLDEYQELLSLSQLFLRREFEKNSYLICSAFQSTSTPKTILSPPKILTAPIPPEIKIEKVPEQKKIIPEKKISVAPPPKIEEEKIEVAAPNTALEISDVRKWVSENHPNQKILDQLPNDQEARKLSQAWKHASQGPAAAILLSTVTDEEKAFLVNVSTAIATRLHQQTIFITTSDEAALQLFINEARSKLLLVQEEIFQSNPEWKQLIRYEGEKYFLKNVELLILKNLSLYLKDPLQKAELWKQLCVLLKDRRQEI